LLSLQGGWKMTVLVDSSMLSARSCLTKLGPHHLLPAYRDILVPSNAHIRENAVDKPLATCQDPNRQGDDR